MKLARRRRKFFWVLILSPVTLILLLVGLLYQPSLQRWAVGRLTETLEEQTGWEIHVEEVRISFPLRLRVDKLLATEGRDTLLWVDELRTTLPLVPLFNKRIEVPRLELRNALVALPLDSLERSRIDARLGSLEAGYAQVDLSSMEIDIAAVTLGDGFFAYTQTDTIPKGKSGSPMSINVNRADLSRFASYIHLYPSGVHSEAQINRGGVDRLLIQLPDFTLQTDHIDLDLAEATYARDTATVRQPYVDYAHMRYQDGLVTLSNLYITNQGVVQMDIEQLRVSEQSGAQIDQLGGYFELQDQEITLRDFTLQTPQSKLAGAITLPLDIFAGDEEAIARAQVHGSLAPQDLYYFTQISLDSMLYRSSPYGYLADAPLTIDLHAEGSLSAFDIHQLQVQQEDLITLSATGQATHLLHKQQRQISIRSDLKTGPASTLLLSLAGLNDGDASVHLPPTMELDLTGTLDGDLIHTDLQLSTPSGAITLMGGYELDQQRYQLDGQIQDLDFSQFIPQLSVGIVSGAIRADGIGVTLSHKNKQGLVGIALDEVNYQSYTLHDLSLDGSIQGDSIALEILTDDPSARIEGLLEAMLLEANQRPAIEGRATLNVSNLDLQSIGLSDSIMEGRMDLTADFYSDFAETHLLDGLLSGLHLAVGRQQIDSERLDLRLASDTTQVLLRLVGSDVDLHITTQEGLRDLLTSVTNVSNWIGSYHFDAPSISAYSDLINVLPNAHIALGVGAQNPLRTWLAQYNISVGSIDLDLLTSPSLGINGRIELQQLQYDTLQCDVALLQMTTFSPSRPVLFDHLMQVSQLLPSESMRPLLQSDLSSQFKSEELNSRYTHPLLQLDLTLESDRWDNHPPYKIISTAQTDLVAMSLDLDWLRDHEMYYSLGASGYYNTHGFAISLADKDIYLAGELLRPNQDNALFYFHKDNQIFANLELTNPRGTKISLRSELDEPTNVQSLLCNVQRLELSDLARILELPSMSGRAFMDVRIERVDGIYRATGDLSVNDMTYLEGTLGNVSVAFFYEPRDNASHYVTAQVSSNGDLAMTANGIYHSQKKENMLDIMASFESFPLRLANPFLGGDLITLGGTLDGSITITGTPKDPMLNGTPYITNGFVDLAITGNRYQLDSQPLSIEESRLTLDKYQLSLQGQQTALSLDGWISLFGPQALKSELRLYADHAQVIDSKRNPKQSIYGRAILSTDLRLQGYLTAPQVRGSVTLHGGTNATYILSQASIKAQNNMSGVVDFVNLSDTLSVEQITKPSNRQSLGRMNLSVALQIDPAVQIGLDLSSRGQDYIHIQGGGDLRLKYSPLAGISLVGRYDFNAGEVQYEFPIVGRRHFDIDPESYLVWSGAPLDPYLHFIASQQLRVDVMEDESSRKVDFEVSIKADENLKDMTLTFDLAAPEDLQTQTQLSSMSDEERGKQAVAMLVSGTFLASDLGQISVEQVLSNVAMRELNNLTGKLLQGTNLSLGMELGGYNQPQLQQTYTYSFSQQFLNDRIRFVIGGRVASGNLPTNYEQTFIDNVTFEYRLDEAGRQYVTLFHRRNNDNILEGVVNETGIGYLVKIKARRFVDLFDPRNYMWWKKKSSSDPQKDRNIQKGETLEKVTPLPPPPATSDSISHSDTISSTSHILKP